MAAHQMLNIRPASPRDVPTILAFIRELADYERLLHEVVADENTLTDTLFGEDPSAEVMIAELGESPAGFALYHSMYSTFIARPGIYLEDLYVRPQHRGLGVGKSLLVALARHAIDAGFCRLDWSVLKWNEPAIGFYEQQGARELDDWTRFRLDGEALTRFAEAG